MAILAQDESHICKHFSTVICADPRLLEEGRNAAQDDRSMACLWEKVMVALYLPGLMPCEQTIVRTRSCSGLKFWHKASVSLCGVLARALRSCGVEIISRVKVGPGKELPWECLKDEGIWGPGGLSSAAHFALQADGTGGTGVTLL